MNKLNCSKCPDIRKRIDCHICNMQKNNEIVDWINEHEVDCKLVDTNIDAETMKKLSAAVAPKLEDCPFCGERPSYIGEHEDRVRCLGDSRCAIYGVAVELPEWNRRAE